MLKNSTSTGAPPQTPLGELTALSLAGSAVRFDYFSSRLLVDYFLAKREQFNE